MTIIIEESKITPTGVYVTASAGKTRAQIAIAASGFYVCCLNASHRAWKGTGRRFESADDARDAYRSAAMKSIIAAAADIAA